MVESRRLDPLPDLMPCPNKQGICFIINSMPKHGKHLHRLLHVDKEALVGVCAACGPVALVKKTNSFRCKVSDARFTGGSYRRRIYRKKVMKSCERCGFVAEHRCQLDVHHKDGDHKNHADENLETLCANCHRYITLMTKGHWSKHLRMAT